MVCHHAECHVGFLTRLVLYSRKFRYLGDNILKYIRVVITLFPLQYAAEAFKAHSRIHVFSGKGFEAAICLTVILHKDQIPDLYHLGMILVHQIASWHFGTFLFTPQIDMNLRTRTTRSRVAHFPEIVFRVAV